MSFQYKALAQAANQILVGDNSREYWPIQAANQILAVIHDSDNPSTVGECWPACWLKAHPQYTMIKEKSIESQQQQAMNVEDIRGFFE